MRRFCIYKDFGGGKSRQPILTCKRLGSDVKVFLAWSYKDGSAGGNKEVYLVGEGFSDGEAVNFKYKVFGTMHRAGYEGDSLWNLKVFSSGTTTLAKTAGTTHEEDLNCNTKDVFSVITPTFSQDWEKSIDKVTLTFSSCSTVNQVEECEIKVEDQVGIQFKPTFKPKALFK